MLSTNSAAASFLAAGVISSGSPSNRVASVANCAVPVSAFKPATCVPICNAVSGLACVYVLVAPVVASVTVRTSVAVLVVSVTLGVTDGGGAAVATLACPAGLNVALRSPVT